MDCHGIYCHYCFSSVLFFKILSAVGKLRLGVPHRVGDGERIDNSFCSL